MKKVVTVVALGLVLAGCAHHYYRLDDGSLRIFLEAPEATSVYFASSLDNFALHPAQKTDSGTWMVGVAADTQFTYFYIIDGRPYVPECTYREHDDFGSNNCVFIPGM